MKKILAFLLCAVMTLSVCVAAFPAHAADNCTDGITPGDVNGDGRQTATDYLRTKRAVLKIEALEGVYYEAAACFDGRDGLTATDYLSMKRAILGLA